MKSKLLITTALITVLAMGSAMAQTSNSNAAAGSSSSSQSGSSSAAVNAGNRQNITFNTPGNTTSNNTSTNRSFDNVSGGTNSTLTNNGDLTVRTTPTVYAPPVSGGNPCTLAVSGGVSVIGWGAAAGGTFVDQDCANRQKIAMIHNAGYPGAAKELMCNDKATYYAFRSAGQPCLPRPEWDGTAAPPPAPMVQMAPAPVVVPPPPPPRMAAPKQYPRCNPARGVTDNCQS